jgi:hypothetical protein
METAACCFDKEHSNRQKNLGYAVLVFWTFTSEGKNFITDLLNRYLLNLSVANHIDWNYLVEGVRMRGERVSRY